MVGLSAPAQVMREEFLPRWEKQVQRGQDSQGDQLAASEPHQL